MVLLDIMLEEVCFIIIILLNFFGVNCIIVDDCLLGWDYDVMVIDNL